MQESEDRRRMERRTSEGIWRVYFADFEKEVITDCPFCQKKLQFVITASLVEPKIFRGSCRYCTFVGGTEELLERWHGLGPQGAVECIRAFDKSGEKALIAEVKKRIAPLSKSLYT